MDFDRKYDFTHFQKIRIFSGFTFKFRVNLPHEGEGNESNCDDLVIEKILTLKRECMLHENHARLQIVKLLSDIRIFVSTNSSIVTAIYSNVISITNETSNIARPKILPFFLEIVLSNVPINDNDRMMREVTIKIRFIGLKKLS